MGKVLQFPNKKQDTGEYRCQWADYEANNPSAIEAFDKSSNLHFRVIRIKRSLEKINEILTKHRKSNQHTSGCVVCGGNPCRCPD